MKGWWMLFPIALAWAVFRLGAAAHQAPAAPTLDSVLKKMDAVAAGFTSAQADFEWDRYEKVIDEVDDVQTGVVYYRRSGANVEMMADIRKDGPSHDELKPQPKYVLFSDDKIQIYQPGPNQLTVYNLGKNGPDVESYLVLGFGASGQDLVKQFDVTYVGTEPAQGVSAAKLQLIPKSEKVRNTFKQFFLWIDLNRGVSVQQKLVTPQDDSRLTKYSNIKLNEPIKNEVFQLKTNKKTQTSNLQR
jgi:outer membrane lipoprotein-sorting protein